MTLDRVPFDNTYPPPVAPSGYPERSRWIWKKFVIAAGANADACLGKTLGAAPSPTCDDADQWSEYQDQQ